MKKTIWNAKSQNGLISKLYTAMNCEIKHNSDQHKHKWDNDIGCVYTSKEWEDLLQSSQKTLVNQRMGTVYICFGSAHI